MEALDEVVREYGRLKGGQGRPNNLLPRTHRLKSLTLLAPFRHGWPERLLQLAHFNLAFAPNRLTANTGPLRRVQVRYKLSEIAFVLSFANESANRMSLSCSRTAALDIDIMNVAAGHPY